MSQIPTQFERRMALYPVTARYRVTDPAGLTICGFPFEYLDELPLDSAIRQTPRRLSQLIEQRKLEFIRDDEPVAGGAQ
jgi:hypothetical protein